MYSIDDFIYSLDDFIPVLGAIAWGFVILNGCSCYFGFS